MHVVELPFFKTADNNHLFYFIKIVKDKLLCWEQIEPNKLVSRVFPISTMTKEILQKIQIWDQLSPEIQKPFVIQNDASIPSQPVQPRPSIPSTHSQPSTPVVPVVKRGRGRPRKNPLPITP